MAKQEKRVRIVMDEAIWAVLRHVERGIAERARQKGLPKPTQRQLLGAILSYFFLRHHEALLSEHTDVATETTKEYLRRYFSPSELAALGASDVPQAERHGAPQDVRPRRKRGPAA